MKDTILLVGHGSRNPVGNQEIEEFTAQWRAARPDWRIELCFIEFSEVTLDDGMDLAARDSSRVIVAPLILNAAAHVRYEIPVHINKAKERHPDTEFVYAAHLGACEPLLSVLQRRLKEAMLALDVPDPRSTGLILLGRGSSDRDANGEVAKMARWLLESCDHELVDIAFTGVTHPRLERVVQRHEQLGIRQVIVLPYYLFAGTLMARISRQMEHLQQQYPLLRFNRTHYLGFEPEVVALLEQRITEAKDSGVSLLVDESCAHTHDHDHDHLDHKHTD